VSEALQNLIIQHGDIRTFLKHYLQRTVTIDARAIYLQLDPQGSIMRAACAMSRWIDVNRPWGLTIEQSLSVNKDPQIEAKVRERTKLKQRIESSSRRKAIDYPRYQKLCREINNKKQRLRYVFLPEVQRRYDREQPVKEVERQLTSIKLEVDPKTASYFSDETSPKQKHLIKMLILAPPGTTYEEEVCRRNNATNAVTAYCRFQEGQTNKREKRSTGLVKPKVITKIEAAEPVTDPTKQALEAAMVSVFKEKRPSRCFVCLGNKNLPLDKRVHCFSTSTDLSKHFRRRHLSQIKDGEKIGCEVCTISLEHKMHFQRHAIDIYGTVS
jgi:hypothetical protein